MTLFARIVPALFALTLLFSSALAMEVGSITLLVGKAQIERGATKLDAINGFSVEEQDKVVTQENSRVQITFKDNTVITLGSQSHLAIKEYLLDMKNPKASFSITQGAFKAITGKIGKIAPQNFRLDTKTATIGIRGTIIEGRVGIDEDIIQCIQGAIVVSSLNPPAGTTPITLQAGEMTTVGVNSAPTPATPIPEGGMGLVSNASQESQESQAQTEGDTAPAERQASASDAPALAEDSLAGLGGVARPSQERESNANQTRRIEEQVKNLTFEPKTERHIASESLSTRDFAFTPYAVTQFGISNGDNRLSVSNVEWQGNRFNLATSQGTLKIMASIDNRVEMIEADGKPWAFILRGVVQDHGLGSTPGGSISLAGGIPYGKNAAGLGTALPSQGVAQTTRDSSIGEGNLAINYATKELLEVLYGDSDFSLLIGKIKPNGEVDSRHTHHLRIGFGRHTIAESLPNPHDPTATDIQLQLYGKEGSENYIIGGYSALRDATSLSSEVEFIAGKMRENPSLGMSQGELSLQGVGVSLNQGRWNTSDRVELKFNRQAAAAGDNIQIIPAAGVQSLSIAPNSLRAYLSDDWFAFFDRGTHAWIVANPRGDDNEYTSWGYWGDARTASINYWVAGRADSAQAARAWIAGRVNQTPATTLAYRGNAMGHVEILTGNVTARKSLSDTSRIDLNFRVGHNTNVIDAGSKLKLEFDGEALEVPIVDLQANAISLAASPQRATFEGGFGTATLASSPTASAPTIGRITGEFYGDEAQAIGGAFNLNTDAGTTKKYKAAGVFHGKKQP